MTNDQPSVVCGCVSAPSALPTWHGASVAHPPVSATPPVSSPRPPRPHPRTAKSSYVTQNSCWTGHQEEYSITRSKGQR